MYSQLLSSLPSTKGSMRCGKEDSCEFYNKHNKISRCKLFNDRRKCSRSNKQHRKIANKAKKENVLLIGIIINSIL